jgi:superfamily II DNA or RNA helicase
MKNKEKAIIESTVVLPLSLLSINLIQGIKSRLTIIKPQSKSFAFTGKKQEEEAIFFFTVEGQNIRVPRKFGIETIRESGFPFVDKRVEGDVLGLTFNEEAQAQKPDLKPTQDSVVRDVANGLLDKHGTNSGLLQAGTGTGKTLMGVKVACTVNRKTLVVVNSEFLAEQWLFHFKKFTDIKDEEIGSIQQDTKDISGKKVVIGMIQTLVRRDFTNEEKKAFGLVIWDEAHRLPAPVFSQTLQKFDAKYLLGLSATPERWDGLDALLGYGLGGKLNNAVMGPQLVPDIYVVYNPSRLNPFLYKYNFGPNAGKINLCKLINLITGLTSRNQYISKLALKAVEKDRKVMVFSDRKDQLRAVQEMIEATLPKSTALFIGGLKKAERDSAKFAKIMLCTYQYAAEALDVPERDCLILASPKSKVKQVMGRILRSQDGKRNPVVVDVVDNNIPILEVFASKRATEYKSIRGRIHLPNGQQLR